MIRPLGRVGFKRIEGEKQVHGFLPERYVNFSSLLEIKDEINPIYLHEDFSKAADLVVRQVLFDALKTQEKHLRKPWTRRQSN